MGYYLPPVCRSACCTLAFCILNQFFLMKAALGAGIPGAACVLLGRLNGRVRVEGVWEMGQDYRGGLILL